MQEPSSLALGDLQREFIANLTRLDPNSSFLAVLDATLPFCAHRFSLYRHQWRVGLKKALILIYPVCVRLVGEKYFWNRVDAYLDLYPSSYISLSEYGAFLANYLEHDRALFDPPYLADVARLNGLYTLR